MESIEKHLKYMSSIKQVEHSVDIYYDDLREDYVVKVKDNLEPSLSEHFRNKELIDSIEQATAFLEAFPKQ